MAANTRKRVARASSKRAAQRVYASGFTFLATNQAYEDACKKSVRRLGAGVRTKAHVTSVDRSGQGAAKKAGESVFVISRLSDLTEAVLQSLSGSSGSRQLVFVNELPVEAVTSRLMKLKIRRSNRLHLASKRDQASESELIQRLVYGVAEDDGINTIVDAWIEGEELVLLSPKFARMRVPRSMLVRFLGARESEFSKFELDEDGRFLYWPHSDTHLGWKQLEQIVNPTAAIKDQKKNDDFKVRYGQAIRSLRESRGLKQADIDGLTERQLRRIEHGQQMVSTKAIKALAKSHQMDTSEYMKELGRLSASK